MSADVHALAGAYALDALPADERAFFERHLAICEACTAEVAELSETAARLGSAAAQAPPPDLRARILAAADVTRQIPPAPAPQVQVPAERSQWRTRMLMPVAACLALVAVGLSAVGLNLNNDLRTANESVAANEEVMGVLAARDLTSVELAMESGSPGRFLFSPSEDEGVLIGHGMDDPGEGRTYELWLIRDGTPIPAGLFGPDSDGTAVAAVEGVRDAQRVAVTIEPAAGSNRPTGPIIASADL